MAWVRIEDTVPEHRKHLDAGPPACWLWVCGLAYCQRQLSDGFIPDSALSVLGVSGTARVKRLADELVRVGLFEREEKGYRIHDYHHYNPTREQALKVRGEKHEAKVKAGRIGAAQRWQKDSTHIAERNSTPIAPSHPIPSQEKKQPSAVGRPKAPPDPRVKEFLAWFQSEYTARRSGAPYLVKWDKHGALVKPMLHAVDLNKLKKYAQIMLSEKCDDPFICESDRGIEVLSAKFNWLSDRLAAWEARRA